MKITAGKDEHVLWFVESSYSDRWTVFTRWKLTLVSGSSIPDLGLKAKQGESIFFKINLSAFNWYDYLSGYIFRTNLCTLLPRFTLMSKTGIGRPKLDRSFYCCVCEITGSALAKGYFRTFPRKSSFFYSCKTTCFRFSVDNEVTHVNFSENLD